MGGIVTLSCLAAERAGWIEIYTLTDEELANPTRPLTQMECACRADFIGGYLGLTTGMIYLDKRLSDARHASGKHSHPIP